MDATLSEPKDPVNLPEQGTAAVSAGDDRKLGLDLTAQSTVSLP
jgi:hypothetical protein